MSDADLAANAVSAVMREMAARRWRGTVPTRLARELLERVDELPEVERVQLRAALDLAGRERQPC
jgi:hypothetical protein